VEGGTNLSLTLRFTRHVTPTVSTPADDAASAAEGASGRVGFDSRGNAVWEWRTADHGFVRDGSTSLVRKLELSHLSIESTGIAKRRLAPQIERTAAAASAPPALPMGTGGGFNPYDRSGHAVARAHVAKHAAPRKSSKIVVTSRGKPGLLDRLQEWVRAEPRSRR
jgi:hypothetical protein